MPHAHNTLSIGALTNAPFRGNSWAIGAGKDVGAGVEGFTSYETIDYDDGRQENFPMDKEDLFVIGGRVQFN